MAHLARLSTLCHILRCWRGRHFVTFSFNAFMSVRAFYKMIVSNSCSKPQAKPKQLREDGHELCFSTRKKLGYKLVQFDSLNITAPSLKIIDEGFQLWGDTVVIMKSSNALSTEIDFCLFCAAGPHKRAKQKVESDFTPAVVFIVLCRQ